MTEDLPDLPLAPGGDPDHPVLDGCERHVLDEHQHAARHDASDEWVVIPLTLLADVAAERNRR